MKQYEPILTLDVPRCSTHSNILGALYQGGGWGPHTNCETCVGSVV